MLIQDIYNQYKIPPHLQLHMLRVAWVCQMICDNWKWGEIHKDWLIQASLLHDMGNIIKFTYWNEVSDKLFEWLDEKDLKITQQNMIEKYWTDDHIANVLICREIWVPEEIIDLVDSVAFSNLQYFESKNDVDKILITYCDLRVWPFWVISMRERLKEAAQRYKRSDRIKEAEAALHLTQKHENDIFNHCWLSSTDITDAAINPLIQDLRKIDISTV